MQKQLQTNEMWLKNNPTSKKHRKKVAMQMQQGRLTIERWLKTNEPIIAEFGRIV